MPCQSQPLSCLDLFGCPKDRCADFSIKRHDIRPSFKITVSDCDGPLDLTDCLVEVSMWAKAKIKKPTTSTDTYFALADNIGFEQSLVGDIIVMDTIRAPEQMLVTGHDEKNKFVRVQRGYNGTQAIDYKRGTSLKIFRILNAMGSTNIVTEDVEQVDGTIINELVESQLIYDWVANDTCLPGCYWFEFKLIKMVTTASIMWFSPAETCISTAPSVIPSFVSIAPADAGCDIGAGVEWVRRFPVEGEGFLIQIFDSPTSESLT